ncbi:MAG: hypothetical protein C0625_16190 [Arcobacter sp.]|nr:MAG: hypothetical protein C0625_16190 [Arcobacter sp.]
MIRIVFPTNEKLSYISTVDSTFDNADYLTVLNVRGQNIVDVETIKNPYIHSKDTIIKTCKENKFSVLISPEGECLPLKKLHKNGVSVYKSNEFKTVLHTFSDFVQDKLEKID